MKNPKTPHFLVCIFFLVTAIGCTSPITKTLRQEAAPGVTFPMVFTNPDAFKGDTVIWGGSIIRTVNTKEGTSIWILQAPLDMRDKPEDALASQGRFIAVTDRRLDPLVFAKGMLVTVAGKLNGQKTVVNKRTGLSYTYPLVQTEQLHLWERTRPMSQEYWGPYWWGYDPFWDFPYDGGFEGDEGREFERHEGHEFEGRRGEGAEEEHERR